MPNYLPRVLSLLLALIILFTPTVAQTPGPTFELSQTPTTDAQAPQAMAQSPPATPTPTATPIPLGEVVDQANSATAVLREIEANIAADQVTARVSQQLPAIATEIDSRRDETARLLRASPSLETLRDLEQGWQKIAEDLRALRRNLTTRATQIDRDYERITQLSSLWKQTLELARASETPPEVIDRIETTNAAIRQTMDRLEQHRANVLTLQNRLAEQDERIVDSLSSVRETRNALVSRLLFRDSPPLWSAEIRPPSIRQLADETKASFALQLTTLRAYVQRQPSGFVVHAVLFLLLVAALYWARRRVRIWVEKEPDLARAAVVFELPFASALLLTLVLSSLIYPEAPRLLRAILGAAALIPTVIVLRRLLERELFTILNALVVFYFLDQLRAVVEPQQLLSRFLFTVEMLGAILFLLWVVKSDRFCKGLDERSISIIRAAAKIGLALFFAALTANVLGYVSLSSLLGDAVLKSAYVAVILYGATLIVEGLILFILRVRPLNELRVISSHRALWRRRLQRLLQWIAVLLWALYTLELFSLRAPLIEVIRGAIIASLTVGSLDISLGDLLAFAITVWIAFLFSRFIRFLLDEDVYPRLQLARGLPYAVSTMLHYAILLAGFFLAVAAVGVDMTRFTILAGAFGVGLGFGLQNIVNNFVSGLIVLFERPVKVGDIVEINNAIGMVKRIGIRASVLGGWDGSEIIVPNGALISDRLTNWTLSNVQRGIQIKVGVAYGSDPNQVIELLKSVAAEHGQIVDDPAPQAFFIEFGSDSLSFELRAWTVDFLEWVKIKSDLTVAINAALAEAHIEIPFPQRDLHFKSIDPKVSKELRRE